MQAKLETAFMCLVTYSCVGYFFGWRVTVLVCYALLCLFTVLHFCETQSPYSFTFMLVYALTTFGVIPFFLCAMARRKIRHFWRARKSE